MKRISFLVVLLSITLAGCGGGDQPVVADPAAATPKEDAVAGAPPMSAEEPATDEAKPEMVEESAAAEEDSRAADQPLVLAQAEASQAARNWKFTEGKQYVRLVPTQPTIGGADKIEVVEVFWYGCPHCYDLEKFITPWKDKLPANVRFVRMAAVWNPLVKLHAQLFYTEQVLVKNGKIAEPENFRTAVFAEYHRRGNRMASVEAIQAVFAKHGVSADDFTSTWNSFEVAQKLRVAQDLGRRYGITGVPTIIVNGKYRTGAGETGGYPELLDVVDELIERESAH